MPPEAPHQTATTGAHPTKSSTSSPAPQPQPHPQTTLATAQPPLPPATCPASLRKTTSSAIPPSSAASQQPARSMYRPLDQAYGAALTAELRESRCLTLARENRFHHRCRIVKSTL